MKLILLFNTRNQSYTLIDHNLEDADAKRETDTLRQQGLPAFSHHQPTLHDADVQDCPYCISLINATMEKGGSKC